MAYLDLINLVVQRLFGVLGKEKTIEALKSVGLPTDANGEVKELPKDGKDALGEFLHHIIDEHGPLSILACKVALRREASKCGCELPDIVAG